MRQVVLDGDKIGDYDAVATHTFSFNRNGQLVFAARRGGTWFWVQDGQEGPAGDRITRLVFSADARRFCYFRKTAGKWLLVTDQGSVDAIGDAADSTAAFSPNGRHLAYSAERNGKQIIVLDGKAGPEFDSLILPPFFVSDDILEYLAANGESLIKDRTTFIPMVDRR